MTTMLSPDLLDRRALALLKPIDVYGRTAEGRLVVHADGIASVQKKDGSIALLEAPGFEDYCASFLTPSSPGAGSKPLAIDLEPVGSEFCPRRFNLRLPRDPDPAKALDVGSLFQAVPVEMLPGPRARLEGSACALRVTVVRKSDKKLVGNALVRARTDDQQFSARGLTDARGQATLIFPALPVAFPGAGASLLAGTEAKVVVTVDPGIATFNAPPPVPRAERSEPPFADPDEIGSAAADFASGAEVTIGAGRDVALTIQWTKP